MSDEVLGKTLISPIGVLTWNNAFRKTQFRDKEPDEQKYSVSILIRANDATLLSMRRDAATAVKEHWGSRRPPKLNTPFQPCPDRFWELGFSEKDYSVKFSSFDPPAVVGAQRTSEGKWKPLRDEDLYSGCLVRVSYQFYCYSNSGNAGIACGLLSVQKLKDAEPIAMGRRGSPNQDFQDIPAEYASVDTTDDDYLTDDEALL